ncbi:unnamed protein product [Bursaphelenchus okinawaensis]|uniref:Beta-lactamase-related domain-containing protein n=1 Tax=Bursaphelenchus okinawaensis TaxID=465554 RepID=A0A811KRQ5_9BILA|nr:unnamed protein product [Bursaphelenchus okinawaensis]CAG9112382.1 unnamed protein product [Bursaphelenchus okinawaensis]
MIGSTIIRSKPLSVSACLGLLIVILCQVFAYFVVPYIRGRAVTADGYYDKKFGYTKQLFEKNFADGYEKGGAAFSVYQNGVNVINVWAGDADDSRNKLWNEDTRTLLFSATKPLSALCLSVLVDKGLINWNDRVAKHWPEYGQNGKENTTIQDILTHQAGLPYLNSTIQLEDVVSRNKIFKIIEEAKPIWVPGTASGYHALTFGWLVEGIVEHVDPQHRTLASFFHEEIASPLGLDVSIGLMKDIDFERSATLQQADVLDYIRDTLVDPRMLVMIAGYYSQGSDSVLARVESNQNWLSMGDLSMNKLEIQKLGLGATNGLGTAHDVARLFSIFLNGSLVNSALVEQMTRPTLSDWHWEKTVLYPIMKGYGFFYDYHPEESGKYVFGHPGYGCQSIHIDPHHNLVAVYLANGLKSTTSHLCRPYQRLLKSVYSAI